MSCEHGNRYDGKGLSFFKNSSGRNSNIGIYNCLNLIDLSLKNVLLRARSWWTGRKRRRPEDEGAPVVHIPGRRSTPFEEDRGQAPVAVFQLPRPPSLLQLNCFVLFCRWQALVAFQRRESGSLPELKLVVVIDILIQIQADVLQPRFSQLISAI